MDPRMYPVAGNQLTDPLNGNLVKQVRVRATAAEVNTGKVVVPAIPGFKLRLADATLISIGGAAAGATTVDVLGTSAGASRKLVAAAVVGLTQSAVGRAGATNFVVLADGASFTANDAGTPITIGKTGANLTGSTAIDVLVTYGIDD